VGEKKEGGVEIAKRDLAMGKRNFAGKRRENGGRTAVVKRSGRGTETETGIESGREGTIAGITAVEIGKRSGVNTATGTDRGATTTGVSRIAAIMEEGIASAETNASSGIANGVIDRKAVAKLEQVVRTDTPSWTYMAHEKAIEETTGDATDRSRDLCVLRGHVNQPMTDCTVFTESIPTHNKIEKVFARYLFALAPFAISLKAAIESIKKSVRNAGL
jgi:hypothetical protein